ncbi:arsinothricin biosynthesis radical SAM protein ArsL [Deinococcus misasensis]|uniref:arsinothricin biosynthesis radical SAM protein ArsL n=1 Tax=Deinococcus misasensis TaxID=392413 RepID=UPI00054E18FA|nr:RCCLKC-tail radical SAM protein [Deinococcus misasensis]
MLNTLLVSVYEGGYQPITLASAARTIKDAGYPVTILDTYVEGVNEDKLRTPELVVISLPLFDAVHPGIEVARRVRELNKDAHITFIGQHATIHQSRLVGPYGDSAISGDWEEPLLQLIEQLSGKTQHPVIPGLANENTLTLQGTVSPVINRKHFKVPDRTVLPDLKKYPNLQINKLLGAEQVVGSTEMARGCHHKCMYCSVYAAYDGKVGLIPLEVVVEDVQNLMKMGMTHLTFIDADWFNAKHHGIQILRELHSRFPSLTYDITTRVDHILENEHLIPELETLGVRIITSALEFPKEDILRIFNKEITMEQTEQALRVMQKSGIKLNPTFIMYNPWIDVSDLSLFHEWIKKVGLEDIVDPIQFETRLSIYKGSPLLQTREVQQMQLEEHEFHYTWKHQDPWVDELYQASLTPLEDGVFKRCCLKC